MEVHHSHHHGHKKKWNEYLLEFFMLFLAVTLGFFAENIREHLAENEKKKELIIAVAEDFTKDINQIQFHKNFNLNKIKIFNNYINERYLYRNNCKNIFINRRPRLFYISFLKLYHF